MLDYEHPEAVAAAVEWCRARIDGIDGHPCRISFSQFFDAHIAGQLGCTAKMGTLMAFMRRAHGDLWRQATQCS